MKDNHLRLTNSLRYHHAGQALILIAIFDLILTLTTIQSFPTLRNTTIPIAVIALFLGGLLLMVEFEVAARNHHRIKTWAQKTYELDLEQDNVEDLYKYSLTEYWDEKNMIQLCLVEKDGKFLLCSTIEIKSLERN